MTTRRSTRAVNILYSTVGPITSGPTERRLMNGWIRAWLAAFIVAALLPSMAQATPANKAALVRHFDHFLSKNLQACTTCHLPSDKKDPDSLEDFPHNPFGDAVRKAGDKLKSEGKKRDLPARLAMIAAEDSDNDGVNNLTELLLGHNPGDAKDVPTQAELQEAPARRTEFATFLNSYRWQPFEPATRPAVPHVASAVRNPIDAFVNEQLELHNLKPSSEAPKVLLLRRVYLDLIGLAPTPEEIAAFDQDSSPEAYETVVDRLLTDPRYGQRWARHWMDVWRYSDWAGWSGGNQIRDSQPFIWRWRDWIVESLNSDKGYDRMALEMLAADELCPEDDANLRATGFLVRNYKMLVREQWMEDDVNHTARAFLGLTMHCAKCHDHKFDPLTQEEYYRLRAIFEPHDVRTDPVAGVADKKKDGLVRAYDKDLVAPTAFYIRGDERTPDKARGTIPPGVPAALGGSFEVKPVQLPRRAAHPDRTKLMRDSLLADSQKSIDEAAAKIAAMKDNAKISPRQRTEAESALATAHAKHDALTVLLRVEESEDAGHKDSADWKTLATETVSAQRKAAVAEVSQNLISIQNAVDEARQRIHPATQPSDQPLIDKATADLKAAEAKIEPAQKVLAAATTALVAPLDAVFKPRPTDDYPVTSTGRRLAFARWLVNAKNPLTARVAANHLWARHFGQGIVPSVDDFGRNGRPATHPALLDWLASELISNGWQMKPIHRLIVTSATYRQASTPDVHALSLDPDDTWLWRFPSRRMEAEIVRDNVLYSANQLDLAQGGPEIDQAQGLTSKRRSLYLRSAPEKEVEFLKIFDGPNTNECYFRRPSVMPQQALALANSQIVLEQSRILSRSLSQKFPPQDDFIRQAFLKILARPATQEEFTTCTEFLTSSKSPPERAREDFIVVLFNHNDFVTIR